MGGEGKTRTFVLGFPSSSFPRIRDLIQLADTSRLSRMLSRGDGRAEFRYEKRLERSARRRRDGRAARARDAARTRARAQAQRAELER